MKDQVVINNLLINFYQAGEGQKTLLFLHGWRSSATAWSEIIKTLDNKDFLIYALDLPGFGGSAMPRASMTVDDYAQIVKEFIEKKGLKSIVLVGHSFGGRIAIKLLANYPHLVEKLVLVDSAGVIMKQNKTNIIRAIAKIVKPFFKPNFMQKARRKIYESLGAQDYLETPELKQTFVNVLNEDLTPYLGKISQPTLIIWGANDEDTPMEIEKIMHQKIINSQEIILENAGHFSFIDQPTKFSEAVVVFGKEPK